MIFENLTELDHRYASVFQFDPGIQMNVDGSEYRKEPVLGEVSYSHLMKMRVIYDTVVDPFGGSSVLIDLLPRFTAIN